MISPNKFSLLASRFFTLFGLNSFLNKPNLVISFENRRTRFLFEIEISLFKLKIKEVELHFVQDFLAKFCARGGANITSAVYSIIK